MILRPPCSRIGQVSASAHSLSDSSLRIDQTKCGAFHCGVVCGARQIGSFLAASKSAAVYLLPVRIAPIGVLGERVEHVVATLDDADVVRIVGHAQLAVGLFLGVAYQVVAGRRLREGGEQRYLAERQLVEVGHVLDAEIAARGGHDAVAAVAVVVLVEVGGDDALLAVDTRKSVGHADRLDDLLDLAFDRAVRVAYEIRVEQALADQLLGDG